MKNYTLLLLLLSSPAIAQYQYVSPKPGSTMNTPGHHIIIREGHLIDPSSIKDNLFTVSGTKSNAHTFRVAFSDDQKTILLYPDQPFGYDEEVTVSIDGGLLTTDRKPIDPYSFSFKTHREYTAAEKESFKKLRPILMEQEREKWGKNEEESSEADPRNITGSFTIVNNTNPSPGEIFYDAWAGNFFPSKFDGYAIIKTNGDSVFQSGKNSSCFDFSINPNGYLSVYNSGQGRFDILDSNLTIIDSYHPGNGRNPDPHEFTIYPDGHAFMVVEETHIVNMKVYDQSYSSNATVMTTIIQEFDQSKNVIFEWRGWDHVIVTESNQYLNNSYIDAIHTNSIDLDPDGNIIASHRHLNQITKIDRSTGNFIWRLGGDSNQFVFTNDAERFSFQHDARRIANGNITVYDNGNGHSPTHSMAKEYQLDEVNKTATLVWSFQPKTYSNGNAYFYAMGSIRRLANGNSLVNGGWDNSSNQSNMWEVTPDGTIVWELALNNQKGLVSYRAMKAIWNPCAVVNPTGVKVKKITTSSAKVNWTVVHNASSYDVQYRKLGNANWKLKNTPNLSQALKNLTPATSYEFQVRAHCLNGYTSDWTPLDTFTTLPAKLLAHGTKAPLSFELVPNPAGDVVNISMDATENEQATITVFNAEGKVMFTTEAVLTPGANSYRIDVSNFPPGFYFAELRSQSVRNVTKFVKQ